MDYTLAISRVGMQNDMTSMETIAHNIANAGTAGFRRAMDVPDVARLEAATQGWGTSPEAESVVVPVGVPPLKTVVVDTPGALRPTRNPLDVALEGEGLFQVRRGGESFYTRRGNFALDSQGTLVLAGTDFTVQGQSGDIRLSSGNPVINANGEIRIDGQVIDRLEVLRFEGEPKLEPMGQGVYRIAAGKSGETIAVPRLRQGMLEASNVDATTEMVRLLELSRHFDVSQRVIRAYDDMMGQSLETLGKF